jgi:UPF0755 protein
MMVCLFFFGPGGVLRPQAQAVTVVIAPKTGVVSLAEQLKQSGAIQTAWPFILAQKLYYPKQPLKAGEYAIDAKAKPLDIIRQMRAGRTVVRYVTIPEGYTVGQILENLQSNPALTGHINEKPEEGTLLPETYHYSYGDARQTILARMKKAMDTLIRELWAQKPAESFIDTPENMLILASIVEKETGVEAERPEIAGVYLNRLKIGMRLQADPTVVYALTTGQNELGRPLTYDDLKKLSPYNTYVVTGLPPGPIACPGKAALQAVLWPKQTNALYFVANGTGGHSFSETFQEHKENVKIWRSARLQKK